jgi:hypothetical protein
MQSVIDRFPGAKLIRVQQRASALGFTFEPLAEGYKLASPTFGLATVASLKDANAILNRAERQGVRT